MDRSGRREASVPSEASARFVAALRPERMLTARRLATSVLALSLLAPASVAVARPVGAGPGGVRAVDPARVRPTAGFRIGFRRVRAGSAAHTACPTTTGAPQYSAGGSGKTIALTFDDGPSPKYTAQILAVLKANHVKATFFLVGKHVDMYPEQARAIADAGMWIGNHTYHHPQRQSTIRAGFMHWPNNWFDKLTTARKATEIDAATASIVKATGVRPCWFRGPGGSQFSSSTRSAVRSRHLANVYWSNDPRDWAQPSHLSASYQNRIVYACEHPLYRHPIILMHESDGLQTSGYAFRGNTPKALDRVIKFYKARGYRFVSPTGWAT